MIRVRARVKVRVRVRVRVRVSRALTAALASLTRFRVQVGDAPGASWG